MPERLNMAVRVVSANGDAPYPSIATALVGAPAGTRVEVRPGVYTAPLVVETPVEIVGDGPVTDIVVQVADALCLVSMAADVSVRNLTLRNSGSEHYEGRPAVAVEAGALRLVGCHVGSDMAAGAVAAGAGVLLMAERCVFSAATDSAVMSERRARTNLADCAIERAFTGATIRQGAELHMTRCVVRDCENAGLSFFEYGSGIIEDCMVERVAMVGIGVLQGSDPTIRRCVVCDCDMNGISVLAHGMPTIEDCVISNHGMEGIVVREVGAPMVRRCTIKGSTHYGIGVYARGQGLFEDCEIAGTMYGGIAVEDEGSAPVVRRCHIRDNDNFGVSSKRGAMGIFEGCAIRDTRGPGLYVADEASPTVRGCTITDGSAEGVVVTGRARGTVESCAIERNATAGLLIDEQSTPMVRECQVRANGDAGLWFDEEAGGTVEGCDISDNAEPAVRITRGADPVLRRCRAHDGQGGGIVRADGGRGRVEDCEELDNASVPAPQEAALVTARNEERERAAGKRETVVFCYRAGGDNDEDALYDGFHTEDDVRLFALVYSVEDGTMDDAEAGAAWQEIHGDDLLNEDEDGEVRFPSADNIRDWDTLPGRGEFCEAAGKLNIPGAGVVLEGLSSASGLVFYVEGAQTLDHLRAVLQGRYRIVVRPDSSYLDARSLVEANRLILEARSAEDPGH